MIEMRAAIVAGGLGTRAAGMTGGRLPKALLPVAGVPIIIRQMRVLRREGVNQLAVLAGFLGDQLRPAIAPEAEELGLRLKSFSKRRSSELPAVFPPLRRRQTTL